MGSRNEVDEKYKYFEVDDGYSYLHKRNKRVGWLDYGGGLWLIAGYEELVAALLDDATFSSAHDLPNGSSRFTGAMIPPTPIRAVPIEVDPPDYRAYRKLLGPRLSADVVEAYGPKIRDYTNWCIDRRIESGSMDLFNDLVKLIPAIITLDLLGTEVADAEVIADAIHTRGEERFHLNPAWALLLRRTFTAMARRRKRTADDLISHLVTAELGGKPLTDMQIVEICMTMVIGGISTTAKLTLGALSYFAVHPDERQRVLDDPALMASALEEFLRYYSPVPFLARTATRDVCVAGTEIKKGDRVAMGFGAANRDPQAFECPNDIVLDRDPNRHLALGRGIHYCMGAGLGRAEALIMIEQVLRRLPDFTISGEHHHTLEGLAEPEGRRPRRAGWGKRLERGLHVVFTPGERSDVDIDLEFTRLPEDAQ